MALECAWVLCGSTFATPPVRRDGNIFCCESCSEKSALQVLWHNSRDQAEFLQWQLTNERNDRKAAAAERSGLIQAVKDALESRAVMMDMERARMQLEDYRSRGL
jgi:hypothetical protein